MDRKENLIIFDDDEQLEFSVRSALPIAEAIETADGFASAVETIADSQTFTDHDALSAEDQLAEQKRTLRVLRLHHFATGIYKLCSDEISERVFASLEAEL